MNDPIQSIVWPAVRALHRVAIRPGNRDDLLVVPIQAASTASVRPQLLLAWIVAHEDLEELTFRALVGVVQDPGSHGLILRFLNNVTRRTRYVRWWLRGTRIIAGTEVDLVETTEPVVATMLRFSYFEKVVKGMYRLLPAELERCQAESALRLRVERDIREVLGNLCSPPSGAADSSSVNEPPEES